MEHFVFQDWITVGGAGTTPLLQEAKDWRGFSSFSDITFYLDVRQIQLSPVTGLTWNFQTSPTKDERLFQTITSYGVSVLPGAVQVLPVINGTGSAPIPLATWVRWQLVGNPGTATWSTTFRVLVAANRVSQGLG